MISDNEIRTVRTALLSVYEKKGLEPLARHLHDSGVRLISTGGTQAFLEQLGLPVLPVQWLTGYPELLDGRVKTLHPAIFAALLSRRSEQDQRELQPYGIEPIDLVVIDLYPFEHTVAVATDEQQIMEHIDIGGVALLRAASKNFREVLVCPSHQFYAPIRHLLQGQKNQTSLADRRHYAAETFRQVARYDTAIAGFIQGQQPEESFQLHLPADMILRYGENPHQQAAFYGRFSELFLKLGGKDLSYNNLLDVDAALGLMQEFTEPCCAIIKHTNACGCATGASVEAAFQRAYAADPQSAFGGIIIVNRTVNEALALALQELFFEVLIAPDFDPKALSVLQQRSRILLQLRTMAQQPPLQTFRSVLNGALVQQADRGFATPESWKVVTEKSPEGQQIADLMFAERCVKHLKSNAIAMVRGGQLVGMGCGQPSRIDAVHQALERARRNGLGADGSVLASDAFFPFADSVEAAAAAGITAILQPGGSRRDPEVIAACNRYNIAMVFTGLRHFRH